MTAQARAKATERALHRDCTPSTCIELSLRAEPDDAIVTPVPCPHLNGGRCAAQHHQAGKAWATVEGARVYQGGAWVQCTLLPGHSGECAWGTTEQPQAVTEKGQELSALDWMDDVSSADIRELEQQAIAHQMAVLRGRLSEVHKQHDRPRWMTLAACASCAVAWRLLGGRE